MAELGFPEHVHITRNSRLSYSNMQAATSTCLTAAQMLHQLSCRGTYKSPALCGVASDVSYTFQPCFPQPRLMHYVCWEYHPGARLCMRAAMSNATQAESMVLCAPSTSAEIYAAANSPAGAECWPGSRAG